MLCFSKFWNFQNFNQSNLLLDRLKLGLKFWFESAWLDHCSIDAGSIECNFRSIELVFRSIENRSESFLKQEFFTCSSLFNFLKRLYSLPLRPVQIQSKFFCRFPLIFLKGFCLPALVRLLCPSFFSFFSFFMPLRENFQTS